MEIRDVAETTQNLPPAAPNEPSSIRIGDLGGSGNTIVGQITVNSSPFSIDADLLQAFWDERGFAGARSKSGPVGPDFFTETSPVKLAARTYEALLEFPEATKALQILQNHRVVIFEGGRNFGKSHLARTCAVDLARNWDLDGILLALSPVGSNLKLDLRALAGRRSAFRKKVLILHDATNHHNPDVLRWLGDTDATAIDELTAELRANENFIILTCDSPETARRSMAIHALTVEVCLPEISRLAALLPAIARQYLDSQVETDAVLEQRLPLFLESHGNLVAERLRSIPLIERFFDSSLTRVVHEQICLEKALGEVDRLDQRIIEKVETDPEWAACILALAVAAAGPADWPIRWAIFDHLRQELSGELRAFLHDGHIRRRLDDLVTDRRFFKELGLAHFEMDHTMVLRPASDLLVGNIWDYLLVQNRSLGFWLRARLASRLADGPAFLRFSVAIALARLSRIDIEPSVADLLGQLSTRLSHARVQALSFLRQGAILAENHELTARCDRIRTLWLGSPAPSKIKAGLKLVGGLGLDDLTRALAELKEVAARKIAPIYQVSQEFHQAETVEAIKVRVEGATAARRRRARLLRAAQQRFTGQSAYVDGLAIQGALQVELAGLALELGPIPVCRQLKRTWMGPNDSSLVPVLAGAFLGDQGIIRLLDSGASSGAEAAGASPFLTTIAQADGGPRILGDCLFHLIANLPEIPPKFAAEFEDRFWDLLEGWSRLGSRDENIAEVVVELWAVMLRGPDREGRNRLEEFLASLREESAGTRLGRFVERIATLPGRG